MNRTVRYNIIALLSLFFFVSAEYYPSHSFAQKTLGQLLQEQKQLEEASQFNYSVSVGNPRRMPGPSEFHMNNLRRNRALQKLAQAQEEVEKAIAVLRKQQEDAQRQQLQKEQHAKAVEQKQQQQLIASEIQTVRTEAQALPSSHSEISWYKERIHETCDLADEANNKKAFVLAVKLTDVARGFLACAKTVARYTEAAALGVWDGGGNVVSAVLHPIDTVKDMAIGIAQLAKAVTEVLIECEFFSWQIVFDIAS